MGILRLFFRKNIPWENRIERESKEFKEKLDNIKFTYYLLLGKRMEKNEKKQNGENQRKEL